MDPSPVGEATYMMHSRHSGRTYNSTWKARHRERLIDPQNTLDHHKNTMSEQRRSVTSSTYSGHSKSGDVAIYHKQDSAGTESGKEKSQLEVSAEAAKKKRRDNKDAREAREAREAKK